MAYDRIEWQVKPRKREKSGYLLKLESSDQDKFEQHTGKAQYQGHLTPGAKKRLKRAIQLIVAIAEPKKAMNFKLNKEFKFRLNFITLTLPVKQGPHTDKELKKLVLDVWLKAAKRRFKLRSYIWRAERQKNGNLHFHLVTDTYIPYDELRDTWNLRLNRLQYIDLFEKKHGHRHPNSTDVHAIKNVRNLAGYFAKYMAKDAPMDQPVTGKLWDCSKNLKYKPNCEMLLESFAYDTWIKAFYDPEVPQKSTDYCTILFLKPDKFKKYVTGEILTNYNMWISHVRNIPDEIIPKPIQIPVHAPF